MAFHQFQIIQKEGGLVSDGPAFLEYCMHFLNSDPQTNYTLVNVTIALFLCEAFWKAKLFFNTSYFA